MLSKRLLGTLVPAALLLTLLLSSVDEQGEARSAATSGIQTDISGLAWVEGDTFLAVHDAKNPEENDRPRVSLLRLPKSLEGVSWQHLQVDWPQPLGLSSDLESVARIPDSNYLLLVESGEASSSGRSFRRAFLSRLTDAELAIVSFIELPDTFRNIEGSAVARFGNRLVFICAERGDGRPETTVYWAELQLEPLKIGEFQQTRFRPVGFAGPDRRPVSAIESDGRGRIYIASAHDPDDDNGPFQSVIWLAGRVALDGRNRVRLIFDRIPRRIATLDGLKVESLAIREGSDGKNELFAGTDDENYGGVLRLIPFSP